MQCANGHFVAGKSMVFWCADARRQREFRGFIEGGEGLGLKEGEYSPQCCFGGAAPLAHRITLNYEHECMKRQIRVGTKNFPIEEFFVIAHEGCAYYTEAGLRQGLDKHPEKTDLRRIGEEIKVIAPSAKRIVLCFAKWDNGKLVFEASEMETSPMPRVLVGQFA